METERFPNFRMIDVPVIDEMRGIPTDEDDVVDDRKNFLDTTKPILVRIENGIPYDVELDPKLLLRKKETPKEKAIKLLGGHCQWPGCGIDDLDMLKIDYKYNDGFGILGTPISQVLHASKSGVMPNQRFQALCENHKNKKLKENIRRRSIGLDAITCVENGSVAVV